MDARPHLIPLSSLLDVIPQLMCQPLRFLGALMIQHLNHETMRKAVTANPRGHNLQTDAENIREAQMNFEKEFPILPDRTSMYGCLGSVKLPHAAVVRRTDPLAPSDR